MQNTIKEDTAFLAKVNDQIEQVVLPDLSLGIKLNLTLNINDVIELARTMQAKDVQAFVGQIVLKSLEKDGNLFGKLDFDQYEKDIQIAVVQKMIKNSFSRN